MRKLKQGENIANYELSAPMLQKKDLELWTCKDASGNEKVIKLLGTSIKSGLREEDLASKLMEIHPDNLLIPEAVGTSDTIFYEVMEVCEKSLYDLIKERGAIAFSTSQDPTAKKPLFSLHETIKIINDIFCGLTTLHAHRLVHLDIKPSNILIKEEEKDLVFLLADFDNVRDLDKTISREKLKEDHGISPYYASPEQLLRDDYYAEMCSDVYSVGVTLFETLTGENIPYGGSKEEKELKMRESQASYILSKYQFEPEILSILQQCLSFDKNERPTAKELYGLTKYYIDSGHWPSMEANPVSSNIPVQNTSNQKVGNPGRKWVLPTAIFLSIAILSYLIFIIGNPFKNEGSNINELLLIGGKGNLEKVLENSSEEELKKGLKIILSNGYRNVRGMNEGIFAVQNESGDWGFIDFRGNEIVPCAYKDVSDFKNGLAIVAQGSQLGVINTKGEYEITPGEYGNSGEILEGGRVMLGNKMIDIQ